MKRRTMLLLSVVGTAMVLGSGVALAATTVECKADEVCRGTKKDETLVGTKKPDEILGQRGDDTLQGRDGGDSLEGDRGDDILEGGDGLDAYAFDKDRWGNDTIIDTVASNTVVFTDKISKDLTINLISGPNPEVESTGGATVEWEGNVIKNVFDGAGDDTITGDDTANLILARRGGLDVISTGDGRDEIFATDGSGGDTIDCGLGTDTVIADSGDLIMPLTCELVSQPD